MLSVLVYAKLPHTGTYSGVFTPLSVSLTVLWPKLLQLKRGVASRTQYQVKAICEEEQAVRQTEQEKKVRQTMIPEVDFARIHPAK